MPALTARAGAALFVVVRAVAGGSVPASAQDDSPPPGGTTTAFLPNAGFHFEWASLLTADRRFDWQARVGFEVDVIETGRWRASLAADYDAVLGRERRRYDLNHGDYTFDIAAGYRARPDTEIVGRLTHVSRHLVDRDNAPAISWNTAGARVVHARQVGRHALGAEIGVDRAMQQAFVDYAWLADLRLTWHHPLGSGAAVFGDATGAVRTIDRALGDRRRICGGRLEGGVRIAGSAASLEIFAGYERRMDAFPTDRFRVRLFTIGARVVTR